MSSHSRKSPSAGGGEGILDGALNEAEVTELHSVIAGLKLQLVRLDTLKQSQAAAYLCHALELIEATVKQSEH